MSRSSHRGLQNLGNTCYMNAVLQALAHAPELSLAMDCQSHRQQHSLKNHETPSSSASSFCTLCALEEQLEALHSKPQPAPSPAHPATPPPASSSPSNLTDPTSTTSLSPFSPAHFVHGFIDHVAPWFQLGLQEDSHEFLRLLIDAMQNSCVQIRNKNKTSAPNNNLQQEEYPFSLFRGTIESNVICDSCGALSKTTDPMEDIGLDCDDHHSPINNDHSSNFKKNNNIESAFQKFIKKEQLDDNYKCEVCGGRATKQTKLASVPPILTLHLKRFRYGMGETGGTPSTFAANTRANASAAASNSANTTNRTNNNSATAASSSMQSRKEPLGGKSGSAKIEGHIQFETLFDLHPYLTPQLQQKHSNLLCRLFAVIVHSGKSAHSGHYYAYVRHLSKNEWWKMDDGRATKVSMDQVLQAEAYMLFYRVVRHPLSLALEQQCKHLQDKSVKGATNTPATQTSTSELLNTNSSSASATSVPGSLSRTASKKRPFSTLFHSGDEWAQVCTTLQSMDRAIFQRAQEYIAEDVTISADFYQVLREEVIRTKSSSSSRKSLPKRRRMEEGHVVTHRNRPLSRLRKGILNVLWRLSREYQGQGWLQKQSGGGKSSSHSSGRTSSRAARLEKSKTSATLPAPSDEGNLL